MIVKDLVSLHTDKNKWFYFYIVGDNTPSFRYAGPLKGLETQPFISPDDEIDRIEPPGEAHCPHARMNNIDIVYVRKPELS